MIKVLFIAAIKTKALVFSVTKFSGFFVEVMDHKHFISYSVGKSRGFGIILMMLTFFVEEYK